MILIPWCDFVIWISIIMMLLKFCTHFLFITTRGRRNIQKSSYQYRDPHVKDKRVSWPSHLEHGNPNIWERRSLYWDGALFLPVSMQGFLSNAILSTHLRPGSDPLSMDIPRNYCKQVKPNDDLTKVPLKLAKLALQSFCVWSSNRKNPYLIRHLFYQHNNFFYIQADHINKKQFILEIQSSTCVNIWLSSNMFTKLCLQNTVWPFLIINKHGKFYHRQRAKVHTSGLCQSQLQSWHLHRINIQSC